jgi:hypothetical protein
MSEYQIYEFLALDRPLRAEDLAYVRTLSSRVQPTPTSMKRKVFPWLREYRNTMKHQ